MDNALKFGTSGLRDTVENMTDRECYINTRGFINFLKQRGELGPGKADVAIGGDLRRSTPRIMSAVSRALEDESCRVVSCGKLPSPALAYYAIKKGIPSIMVTGSHIPEDRNGIKFTKRSGEVLKSDEGDILENVAKVRSGIMEDTEIKALFDKNGMFIKSVKEPLNTAGEEAVELYARRYLDVFHPESLKELKVVLYQHSAVGRDIIKRVLEGLGAEVAAVERSEKFVPVDTEKISKQTLILLEKWAKEHKPFAVVSTDGDSDRPLVADENGTFVPGDKLGALVSMYLEPDFAAVPVSANDAVLDALTERGIKVSQTKIGSPYVVKAMADQIAAHPDMKVVSWESNGGFLLGSDWPIDGKILGALPTRDAILPVIAVLLLAKREECSLAELVDKKLPARYTDAGVVDNSTPGCEVYTADMGKKIVESLTPSDERIYQVDFLNREAVLQGKEAGDEDKREIALIRDKISGYFTSGRGFGAVESINFIDGIRIVFEGRDVVHLRPSGNAPEFRVYATADSRQRAGDIVSMKDVIIPVILKDTLGGALRSVGAMAFSGNELAPEVSEAIRKGTPFLIEPHNELKVWGVNGVGEFWYGPGGEGKSSIAVVAGHKVPIDEIMAVMPKDLLGVKVVEKFGVMAPLVKILTPKGRLSVQFHDSKNELWIVTSCDKSLSNGESWIILGFSRQSVEKYGKNVTSAYEKALSEYGNKLNILIDEVEGIGEEGKSLLLARRDVLEAAGYFKDKIPSVGKALEDFLFSRQAVEYFYNYRQVDAGDVIPVPSGTLHALGPGVFIIEPQIAGPTQSLEDGTTYPVRYYFPGYQREGALKRLDIERAGEMTPEVTSSVPPDIIGGGDGYEIQRLPGNFAEKGLEARRIIFKKSSIIKGCDNSSMHSLVVSKGKAFICFEGKEYSVPAAVPGGEMLIVPASCSGYDISTVAGTEIIDTFTPA